MSAELLTIQAVADRIGRSRWYVKALIGDGTLQTRTRRGGGRAYITAQSLDDWLGGGAPDPNPAERLVDIPAVVKVRGRAA